MNRVSGRGEEKAGTGIKSDDRLERRTTMKRIVLILSIFLLATLISGWVNLAEAQQEGKIPRIGYLSTRSAEEQKSLLAAFR